MLLFQLAVAFFQLTKASIRVLAHDSLLANAHIGIYGDHFLYVNAFLETSLDFTFKGPFRNTELAYAFVKV